MLSKRAFHYFIFIQSIHLVTPFQIAFALMAFQSMKYRLTLPKE